MNGSYLNYRLNYAIVTSTTIVWCASVNVYQRHAAYLYTRRHLRTVPSGRVSALQARLQADCASAERLL